MAYELAEKWARIMSENGTSATITMIAQLPEDQIQAIYSDCESAFNNDALGDLHIWAWTVVRDIHSGIWHPKWRVDEEAYYARQKANATPLKEYVYLLWTSTGIYKIGYTSNPARRLANYKAMPFQCGWVCLIESQDGRALEAELLKKFKDKVQRPKREWFALDNDDVEYIKGLANVNNL